jgi:hypothetical protein
MIPDIQSEQTQLIVILPDGMAGNLDFAHKVHWMALQEQRKVLYLTLVEDYDKILSKSRSMATMTAVTGGNILRVNSKLVVASDLSKTLQEISRADDIIVCQAEQSVQKGLIGIVAMEEYICSILTNRVVVVSGYYKPVREHLKRLSAQFFFFFGFLVIFSLFTLLEVYLDHDLVGLPRIILLCTLICCEFGAVYAWNNIVGS